MGFIERGKTRKRVLPSTGPLAPSMVGEQWALNGGIAGGAVARAAAFALALKGMRSSPHRGAVTEIFGMAVLFDHQATRLWVEAPTLERWRFTLGVPAEDGRIEPDWTVELNVDRGRSVSVMTTSMTVDDDALRHGDEHDRLREGLVDGFGSGRWSDDRASEVSARSLAVSQPFVSPPPEPFELAFGFTADLTDTEFRGRLAKVGFRLLEDESGLLRFGLGLSNEEDHVAVRIVPGRLHMTAQVTSKSGASRRIASASLRQFIERVKALLFVSDQSSTYLGPTEWVS